MTTTQRMLRMFCALTAFAIAGCAEDAASPELRDKLNARLSTLSSGDDAVLTTFYAQRSYQPYWLSSCGYFLTSGTSCGARLIEQFRRAEARGLDAEDYRADELGKQLERLESSDAGADLEIALSQAYLLYAADLSRGRLDPDATTHSWLIPRPAFDPATALARVEQLGPEDALAAAEPGSAEYRRLIKARPIMVRHVQQGGWPMVEYDGLIRPGERHAALPALRRRLAVTGELDRRRAASANQSANPDFYDEATAEAVRTFQRRHGLEPDAILGPEAEAMLSVSASERLAQIDLNLERLRWLGSADGRRVRVNLASFHLQALDDDKVLFDMPVIVGEEQTATPSFADQIEYIEINPYWVVPRSIIASEIAPAAAQEPGYVQAKGMEVIDRAAESAAVVDPATVDWKRYVDPKLEFPYVVRQKPGKDNALGRIKFIFPNKHAIYLHDTPATELFQRAKRTFSHGCIRVRHPLDLAGFLLAESEDWDKPAVRAAIESGAQKRITLDKKVPVTIYYLTAWAAPDGERLHFRPDIYELDRRLHRELAKAGAADG